MRWGAAWLAVMLMLSCNPFRRKPKPQPPSAPAPAATAKPEPKAEPPTMPTPPPIQTPTPTTAQPPPVITPQPPAAQPPPVEAPAPKPERPSRRPSAPEIPPVPAPEPPVTLPQLTPLMTSGEQREYNRAIDESLRRARRVLALAARYTLNGTQTATVVRVRSFAEQAEESRKQDLVTARSLAARADLLARELERTLR